MSVSLSLLLLAALFAVSYAQPAPAPPTMPETFEGSGEIEFHGPEETAFGRCKLSFFSF